MRPGSIDCAQSESDSRTNAEIWEHADPLEQMRLAVLAVFDSWNSPRAVKYRSINQISGLQGTAVNVQAMVFGNMGPTSGTGVLFTRNPSTGEKKLYGEYLINAQVSLSPLSVSS